MKNVKIDSVLFFGVIIRIQKTLWLNMTLSLYLTARAVQSCRSYVHQSLHLRVPIHLWGEGGGGGEGGTDRQFTALRNKIYSFEMPCFLRLTWLVLMAYIHHEHDITHTHTKYNICYASQSFRSQFFWELYIPPTPSHICKKITVTINMKLRSVQSSFTINVLI